MNWKPIRTTKKLTVNSCELSAHGTKKQNIYASGAKDVGVGKLDYSIVFGFIKAYKTSSLGVRVSGFLGQMSVILFDGECESQF